MSRRGNWIVLVATLTLALCSLAQPAWADRLTLQAQDGQGRVFDLGGLRGRVVVLSMGSHRSRVDLERVNDALRERARAGEVALVTMVDLGPVPSLFHGLARRRISAAEHEQRVVKFLIDEDGALRRRLGGCEPQKDGKEHADVLVIAPDGSVRGRFCGAVELPRLKALVARLRPPSDRLAAN